MNGMAREVEWHQLPDLDTRRRHDLTFDRIPVPKNAMMGKMAITPISPTQASNFFSIHHMQMVTAVMKSTYQCVQVNGSVFFLIRGIVRSCSQR